MSLLTYLMITNYYLDVRKGVPYTNYSGGLYVEKEAEEYARNKMGGKEFELITDDDVSKYEETRKD